MCFSSNKLRDCSIIFIEIYARKAVKSFSMKLGHRSPSEVIADGETDPSIKVKVQESAAFYYHNLTVVARSTTSFDQKTVEGKCSAALGVIGSLVVWHKDQSL
jgi:hypothetical protein